MLIGIENLNNIKYNLIKVYSNCEELKLDDSNFIFTISFDKFNNHTELVNPNIKSPTKYNKLIINSISIDSIYIIKYSNFENLYLSYVASK